MDFSKTFHHIKLHYSTMNYIPASTILASSNGSNTNIVHDKVKNYWDEFSKQYDVYTKFHKNQSVPLLLMSTADSRGQMVQPANRLLKKELFLQNFLQYTLLPHIYVFCTCNYFDKHYFNHIFWQTINFVISTKTCT